MKKRVWMSGAGVGALSFSLLLAFTGTAEAGTIPSGLTVAGYDLTGLTREEAAQKLEEHFDLMAAQTVTLVVGENQVEAAAGDLGLTWVNEEAVREELNLAAGGNLLRRYLNQQRLEQQAVSLEIETAADAAQVAEFVATQCGAFVQEPIDAVITRENGAFHVTESEKGLQIDTAATTEALNTAFQKGLDGPLTIEAVCQASEPFRTTEALSSIQDVLGTFSTNFNAGNGSRSKNVRNGASKVNGSVLMPGEEFSAYTVLTPFTVENGYASAASYSNGQVVDTVGGGACQLCTTLYNTALLSEMEITQRQNHSMIVTYVKPSQDAAIAGTVKDLKFKNPYDTPIYIEGSVNGGTLTFTIYGKETRPANREIKFVSETLGRRDPGEPIMKVDPSLAPGAQVKEQSAHVGMQSRLWKYVYVDGVETEKEILHTDSYMASKAIYRVGPALPAVTPPPAVLPDPNQQVPGSQPGQPGSAGGPASEILPVQPDGQQAPGGQLDAGITPPADPTAGTPAA